MSFSIILSNIPASTIFGIAATFEMLNKKNSLVKSNFFCFASKLWLQIVNNNKSANIIEIVSFFYLE